MDIKDMRAFYAIVEEGNISHAAQRLDIAQPALSRQMKRLETSLGVQLFERGSRRIRLTDAGRVMYSRVEHILGMVDGTVREITEIGSGIAGSVRLGTITTSGALLLPELISKGEQYDVVVLDPPAFTKSRNSIKAAARGYREINLRGMKLVRNGGYLVTCSCSHFMDPELFTKTIGEAARDAHRRLRQVEFRTQAPDHPILWASDESYYLKFYIFQVVEEL